VIEKNTLGQQNFVPLKKESIYRPTRDDDDRSPLSLAGKTELGFGIELTRSVGRCRGSWCG